MTTVLPAWKVELIEKKKRKEQDQRQKLEQEKFRKTSIPEWKRSLIEKKKESTIDSQEVKEQASHVNTLFGPRIVRKASQTNSLVVNSSCKQVVKNGEVDKTRKIVNDINASQGGPALFSSPADTNSCVTKGVEIPTELEHKPNKPGTRIEIESNQESSQRANFIANGVDLKATLNDDNPSVLNPNDDIRHVKTPSVLSYRRMFEHSKPEINGETNVPRLLKGTENKARVRSDKRTVESALGAANGESHQSSSQLQILTTSAVDSVQSIPETDNSLSLHVDSIERKSSILRPFVAPKPYKNYVATPPWLKHEASKNSAFLAGKEELLVANVYDEVPNATKDLETLDHKKDVVLDSKGEDDFENFDGQPLRAKFNDHSDLVIPLIDSQREEALQTCAQKTIVPQEQSLQKYLLVKNTDSKEEVRSFKSDENVDKQKYILMEGKSQQELISSNNVDKKIASATINNVSNVPHESSTPKADDILNTSSIDSLRSKFGAVGGFRKRTPSEENLSLRGSQSEPLSEQGCVIRRSAELKRPAPPMKRWSADVLSLMSKPIDDDDDDGDVSNLSPRSDTKSALSSANSQPKRPPAPTKRWTADVMSVVSPRTDDRAINSSSRSDSSKKSSPSSSLERGKSSSLIDVREDASHECFQHKSNVAHGIEHRVNKLIRRASVSDLLLVDDEESDSTTEDDPISEAYLHGTFESEITSTDHVFTPKENDEFLPTTVHSPDQDIKPVFARKRSVSSDIEHRVTELLHRQLSQQSDNDDLEEDKTLESDSKVIVAKVEDSVKELTPESPKTETVHLVETKPVAPADPEPAEASEQIKPARGSVHKLSALFGSSIWKPNKKDKSAHEEKSKKKVNYLDMSHAPVKTGKKSSSEEKVDSKKSTLFNRSNKTEAKSVQKEKQQSIFPWMKKNSKDKESTPSHKTKEVMDKNQKNNSGHPKDNSETVSLSSHGLQPVGKTGKVEQRLVGNVVIISDASHDNTPPKGVYHKPKSSVQISEPQKEESYMGKVNHPKPEEKRAEICTSGVVTQEWNGNLQSSEVEKSMSESVPITSIDEVPVSAIDIPELPHDSDVTVSVIDVPPSPDVRSAQNVSFVNGFQEKVEHTDDDVHVSVIDVPSPVINEQTNAFQDGYLETDEFSDGSDMDDVEGSYDFATGEVTHLVNGDISEDEDEDEEDGEEEQEEDNDNEEDVPISYIGAAPQYPVPQVVFNSEPVKLKSCLSPKTERRKVSLIPTFLYPFPPKISVIVIILFVFQTIPILV